jgi:hypothetical protein
MSKPTFEALRRRLQQLDKGSVKVGILAGAGDDDEFSLVELATIHEFGNGHVPERSFLRSTFRRERAALVKLCARLVKGVMNDTLTAERAFGLLGEWGVAQVQRTIRKRLTEGPEDQRNAPATIAKKGSDTPLVDLGILAASITHKVEL